MMKSLAAKIGLTTAVGPGRERRPRAFAVAPVALLIAGVGLVGAHAGGALELGGVRNTVDGQTLYTLHGHGHGH